MAVLEDPMACSFLIVVKAFPLHIDSFRDSMSHLCGSCHSLSENSHYSSLFRITMKWKWKMFEIYWNTMKRKPQTCQTKILLPITMKQNVINNNVKNWWIRFPVFIQNENENKRHFHSKYILTHFIPLVSFFFYTPWKHQKTRGFLMFSGGIERDQ